MMIFAFKFLCLIVIYFLTSYPVQANSSKRAAQKDVKIENQEPLKLVLNWQPEPEFGGFYAADPHAGLKPGRVPKRTANTFEKVLGRRVQILPGGSGTPTAQMVASGAAEFGISSSGEIITGMTKGSSLIPLFAVYQTSPLVFIAHAKFGSRFNSLEDLLASKEIVLSMSQGYPGLLRLRRLYEEKGKKIQAQIVPYRGGISHFLTAENHAQQGFVHSELVLINEAIAKKNQENKKLGLPLEPPAVSFQMPQSGYHPYIAVLVTRKDFFEKNKDLVRNMVKVVRSGWIDYLKDPQEVNERMHVLNPSLEVSSMNTGAQLQREFIQPSDFPYAKVGTMTKERWLNVAVQLALVDVVPKMPLANLGSPGQKVPPEEEWRKAWSTEIDKICEFCFYGPSCPCWL